MKEQSEYNIWFRAMVTKHCPILFAQVIDKSHHDMVYIVAVIPHVDEKRSISVSTYGRELTVFIHTHHCHFDTHSDDDHEEEFTDMIEWIQDFIDNKLFICTRYRENRIVSTGSTYDRDGLKTGDADRIEIVTYAEDDASQ
jgi:hypothetical protein